MASESNSILYKTVKWLLKERQISICIHDTSGVLHNTAKLNLPLEYSIHSCAFCDVAKTTAEGMRACLRCKSAAIRKAARLKETYIGQCYLGITEIVRPVYSADSLIGVIFIGNMVKKSSLQKVHEGITRNSARTGVDENKLFELLKTAEEVTEDQLMEYNELADILEEIIIRTVDENTRLRSKQGNMSPIYIQQGHWVVGMLRNYAAAYYNRDIRLSQLAKLYFLNAQYLSRLFRKDTGTHFSDYVNRVRINNSKHLLEHTDDDIIEIAGKIGFNNVTYYNRLFKRYTGMNPGDWRKQRKVQE